ncbi:hypothetical protein OIU77_001778 [Salix suchowensis]|uniref:Uncharacterized protein n=1 Tax=Salix suchowensis TaxID=1278906 RepID=A0ABQ9B5L0_9ROSI|nr:hypothetical protein OIU77_001778 [Salix suchowensis]
MATADQEMDNSVENSKFQLVKLFQERYPPGFLRKVVAELIATYLLIFVTCGAAAISDSDEHKVSKLGASVAGGLVVTVMIYAVGHISGAHMNPAVTTAFAAVLDFPWKQVPYCNIASSILMFRSVFVHFNLLYLICFGGKYFTMRSALGLFRRLIFYVQVCLGGSYSMFWRSMVNILR